VYERVANHPKLKKLLGKDGKFNMEAYTKLHPMPTGEAAAAEKMRRLRLLMQTLPLPFELYSKRDRAINSCS